MIRFTPGGFLKSGFNAVNAGPVSYGSALFLVTGITTGDIVGGRGATTTAQTTAGGATQKWAYGSLSIPENGSNSILSYTTNVSGLKLDTSKTFDCWVYVSNSNLNAGIGVYKMGLFTAWVGGANVSFNIVSVNNSGGTKWGLEVVTSSLSTRFWTTEVITPNQWTHVALEVDAGGTAYVYCDGNKITTTAAGSPSSTPTFTLSGTVDRVDIGQASDSGTGIFMQDARVSTQLYNGAATYTVPTASAMAGFRWKVANVLVGDTYRANRKLVLHGNGSNGSTTLTDSSPSGVVFTANGTAQLSTTSPKIGSASAYFDGSGHFGSTTSNSGLSVGTGDFTLRFWTKPTVINDGGYIQLCTTSGGLQTSYVGAIQVATDSAGNGRKLLIIVDNVVINATVALTANVWQHVAIVRQSGTVSVYIDGVFKASGTSAGAINATYAALGCYYSTTYRLTGYIDEVVFSNFAEYASGFTPPTTELLDY